MKHVFSLLLPALVLSGALLFSACEDDPASGGNGESKISGTVTFLNSASWPGVGEVQVSIYANLTGPDYIPMGPPDAFTNAIAQTSTYNYSFEGLDNGTYAGVLVSWRDPANPAGARLLGMYWVHEDSVAIDEGTGGAKAPGPTPIVISDADPTHTGLNILADIGIVP